MHRQRSKHIVDMKNTKTRSGDSGRTLTARHLEGYLANLNENGKLNPEEVFLHGNPEAAVEGVCVCWMATVPAILYAARHGCNLMVCHEAITFHDYPLWAKWVETTGPWPSDRDRIDLLERHHMTVLRVHSTVDVTHVGPALWDALDLPAPALRGWVYSHHAVDPISVARLAARMRTGLRVDTVRVTGDPLRVVTEVGTCWGGGGLDRNMHIWQEQLLPRGIEALIVGETCDFAHRFAMDNGIALLEGGHSATEDPGLERLAGDISNRFPGLKVIFRPQEVPWITL